MTIHGMSLTDPDTGNTMTLIPNDNLNVAVWDVAATAREVVYDRPGQDGQRDNTEFLGAAAVSMELGLKSNIGFTLDTLAPLLHPGVRPLLVVDDDEYPAGPRQILLRFASKVGPYEADNFRLLALGWTAPEGLWEDAAPSTVSVAGPPPADGGLAVGSTGLAVGATGLAITASDSASSRLVTGGGSVKRPFRARLYGPCTGPKLTNDVLTITGKPNGNMIFADSVSVLAGEYIEVDTAAKTATRNSDPTQPVALDWGNSDWWLIQPGENLIRYHPTSADAPVVAVITWTAARMP